MEDVLKEGKTRSIGVSNYMLDQMKETLETAKVSRGGMSSLMTTSRDADGSESL
jgi:aryl-alcohol dehydrogenase-like predicted oxidoreductase